MSCRTDLVSVLLLGVSSSAMAALIADRANAQQPLDPITVLATKTEEKAIDSLAGVSTVRQEQLEQIKPGKVSDIMMGVPGVWFQERGDSPESSINIRGLQDFGRVAVVVDGARQNFQRSGHLANGTFFLEPALLAGVDIIRGPVANIYGSGAIGGVASFRTKDTDDILKQGERWGVEASAETGSNPSPRGLGTLFGAVRVNPNVDVFVGGTFRDMDNYKDGNGNEVVNSAYDTKTGIGKVTVRPADGHEVKLGALTYESNFETGQQIPNRESVFQTNVRQDQFNARWKYQRPEDNIFDSEVSAYWTMTEQNQTKIANGVPGSPGNPITGFIGDSRRFSLDTKGFDVHNTSRFVTGPLRHAVTFGGDYFLDEVDNFDPTGNGAITTPNGERTVSGGFGQWKINYSSWLEIISALRYDNYQLVSPTNSAQGDHLSPKVTVGVTPIAGVTVYGTVAEGYRAPAITETLVSGAHPPFAIGFPNLFTFVSNPNLQPEIGRTKEVGMNFKFDDVFIKGDKVRAKLNVFRNDVSNFIELVSFGPPVTFCPAPVPGCPPVPVITINPTSLVQYQNIGDARLEGVEIEGIYDSGFWFAGLAGSHIRGHDRTSGQPLASVPPDKIATTLGVRLMEQRLTLAVRWTAVAAKSGSEIPDRDRNGFPDFLPTDSFNLVNLYADYQLSKNAKASLSIENILNEFYVPYLAGQPNIPGNPPGIVFPGPGITVKAGLNVRFSGS